MALSMILLLLVIVALVVFVAPRVARGTLREGHAAATDAAAQAAMVDRLARMEEAIQVMATEIERLRAARAAEGRYLPGSADTPRASPTSEDDPTPA